MNQDGPLSRVRFRPFEADLTTQEIWRDGVRLKLARQPFEILALLVSRPGELVSRDELQRRLWDEGHFVDASHGLNAAVNKLRETLCDSADEPKYIETLPRRGYRFIGKLTRDEIVEECDTAPAGTPSAESAEALASSPVASESISIPPELPPSIPSTTFRRWPIWIAASAALIVGGLIGASWNLGARNTQRALLEALRKEKAEKKELTVRYAEQAQASTAPKVDAAPAIRIEQKTRMATLPAREMHDDLRPAEFRTIIPGDSGNAAPQISPDGGKIAFMSNRSGPWQIWMSNADGSDPVQISFTDSAGTPRWSPDGKSLVFDAPWHDATFVFLAPVDHPDRARPIAEGCVPSFSRDGRFVYYASDRTGDYQVWKVAVAGGPEIQVTQQGGFAALESQDGNIYYSKSRYPNPEIWRVPLKGSEEIAISPIMRPRTWASWTVTKDGVLLVADLPDGRSHLTLYDPASGVARDLTSLQTSPFWMAASADGKKVVMNDSAERQITMVSNLR